MAEVLITIGIIGVITALLAPHIIDKFERKKNAVILKRAYSDLQSYINMYTTEKGCEILSNCDPVSYTFVPNFAKWLHNKLGFKDIYEFLPNPTWLYYTKNGNFAGDPGVSSKPVSSEAGGRYLVYPSGIYSLYIQVYMYDNFYTNCNYKKNPCDIYKARVYITTDMRYNGQLKYGGWEPEKHPKEFPTAGKNFFYMFIMDSKRILPQGSPYCSDWQYYCKALPASGSCQDDHLTCMQKVINDGWQIKYKY